MDSDYRDAQERVLRAMGYERLVGTVAEWAVLDGLNADGTAHIKALVHERNIDATWCFGVLVPWLEAKGFMWGVWKGMGAGVTARVTIDAFPHVVTAPTVEEALIRAAASALEQTKAPD